MASRLYVSGSVATGILYNLLQRQFVVVEARQPLRFRYSAAGDATGLMPKVAAAYRRNLVAMTTFIHSRAPSAVQEFARAFDLKKDR